ncbi:MAG: proprotein convertase P-domain-containing protein [Erythrobacter sp.]
MQRQSLNHALTMFPYAGRMSRTTRIPPAKSALAWVLRALLMMLTITIAIPAAAQTTTTYSNTTTGAINSSTRCSSPLVRTFSVSASFTVSDVDIGILATHSWRGDLQFTLQSPQGTRVQLTNGDTSAVSGDNFNVLLDDSATQMVNTDSATGNHSTSAPPYQNTFRPRNPLSAFAGENASGTWRLETCDLYPSADNGTFVRADLFLTSPPSNFADMSLTKTIVSSDPVDGGTVTYRLTVSNSAISTQSATGVSVRDTLPAQLAFSSASGSGSFNPATGIWTLPSLAAGASASIDITATISAGSGTSITNTAEIASSNQTDSDSTPNNGASGEDDYASISFTVQAGRAAGIPPALNCPNGAGLFDWDASSISWTAGTVSNSYALGSFGNIAFNLTNDGVYINNAAFGGQSPTLQSTFTGGISPAERSLGVVANQSNRSGVVTITIALPRAFDGVQFSIFDVDFANNQFTDRVVVTGSNGGASVLPTLTNGNSNYVTGNTAIGDAASNSDSARGNLVVTFASKVDTIVITYGNHTTAPADPGQQGIALHDIEFCLPFTTLGVTKLSSVISDPVNGATNPKAIPGALIEYLISVTNTGTEPADSDSVVVADDTPADAKMCLADLGGPGSGPVLFGAGSPASGLSYSFAALGNGTDDLEFSSDDGATWTYVPTADADGCDGAVSNFRVRPAGAFAAATGFTLRVRFIVE